MLIDLHCHTKKIKSGEAETRNVTTSKFAEKVLEANVKIVAITNHNHFDIDQYHKFWKATFTYCDVWPGVELDIRGRSKRYHLIIIANPSNVERFKNQLDVLIGDINPDKFKIELNDVFDSLDCCDVLYITHFHKEPKISKEDIEELESLLDDKSRLFKETSDYRSLGVFANFDHSVILGSDNHNWTSYEQSKFADIRLPVESFNQFCLLAKKDRVIINTLLNKKNCTKIQVSPHESVKFTLPIFQDVNVFFGQKGTGKSEIISSISKYYDQMSIQYQKYVGSEKEVGFEKLLSISDMKAKTENLELSNLADEFKSIYDWKEKMPTSFQSYIEWMETKDNNKNKSKMKITNAVTINKYQKSEELEADYKIVGDLLAKKIDKIRFSEYLEEKETEDFVRLLNILISRISKSTFEEWSESKAVELSNWSIEKIKNIADRCSDTVSKPSTTGFREFAIERLKLYNLAKKIEKAFSASEHYEDEYLGLIDEKGNINIRSRQRVLCRDSKTEEFSLGINDLKRMKKAIENLLNEFKSEELFNVLTTFSEYYDKGIKDISCFIGLSKETVLSNGESYTPSNGERGILVLQKILSTDSEVYLLDEPELGMGNSYINSAILPKIIKHAKNKKTVVVATHNANIAVRTLPYTSVLRTHKNGKYYTYLGNPFCDDLINIEDESDTKNWTYESMHTLEGGTEAFYERKDIYESGTKID